MKINYKKLLSAFLQNIYIKHFSQQIFSQQIL